jgi:hypothetical protein
MESERNNDDLLNKLLKLKNVGPDNPVIFGFEYDDVYRVVEFNLIKANSRLGETAYGVELLRGSETSGKIKCFTVAKMNKLTQLSAKTAEMILATNSQFGKL